MGRSYAAWFTGHRGHHGQLCLHACGSYREEAALAWEDGPVWPGQGHGERALFLAATGPTSDGAESQALRSAGWAGVGEGRALDNVEKPRVLSLVPKHT